MGDINTSGYGLVGSSRSPFSIVGILDFGWWQREMDVLRRCFFLLSRLVGGDSKCG